MQKYLTFALLLLGVACGTAQTIYVATTGSDVDGDGSLSQPFLTISNGVAKAAAGAIVLVADGVYTQTVNIHITNDIALRGMHAPTGVVITTCYPDPVYSTRCVRLSSAGAVFYGFTVEYGYPPNELAYQYASGGGILVEAGLATNCIFRHNHARYGGGAALWGSNAIMRKCWISNNICDNGSPVHGCGVFLGDYNGAQGGAQLLDCTVNNNTGELAAVKYGGGVSTLAPDGLISNCVIAGNFLPGANGAYGGGINAAGPNLLIIASTVSNNSSETTGGGIHAPGITSLTIQDCDITMNRSRVAGAGVHVQRTAPSGGAVITNCVISGNHFENYSSGYGAGICDGYHTGATSSGKLVVANTRIVNNGGTTNDRRGGGAYINTHGTAIFHNCEISGNVLLSDYDKNGAGMLILTGSAHVVIQNCLVAGNHIPPSDDTGEGGGISLGVGSSSGPNPLDVKILSCTIVSNSTKSYYGGIQGLTNNLEVWNTLIASNAAPSNPDLNSAAAYIVPFHYSCCPVLINTENHNITSPPEFADYAAGDYRLKPGSDCVNAGANESWMDGATDLDGHARPDRFSGLPDIGCYEYVPKGTLIGLR